MTVLPVSDPRSRIDDTPDGLVIEMPAPRAIPVAVFLCFWLAGWAFGEVTVIRALLSGRTPAPAMVFMGVWLTAWTMGGLAALTTMLWMVAGRERLILGSDALVVRREVLGIGRSESFPLAGVADLQALPAPLAASVPGWMRGLLPSGIVFRCGRRTVRVGGALAPEENTAIVSMLRQRHAFPGPGPTA